MSELQRAVALAERRAFESVAGERFKMELLMESSKNKAVKGEARQQRPPPQDADADQVSGWLAIRIAAN